MVTEGSVTTNVPTIDRDSNDAVNTKVTWTTTLNVPGDFYEFTVDAVNNGTIDAVITGIETDATPELPDYVKFTVKYADGTDVANNHLLRKKIGNIAGTEKYRVRVEFLDTITEEEINAIPDGGLIFTITYNVTYGQAGASAIARDCQEISTGSATYGYQTRFSESDWILTGSNSRTPVSPDKIVVANGPFFDGTTKYAFPKKLPEDYSFEGRFTMDIKENTNSDEIDGHMYFGIKRSDINSIESEILIKLDLVRNSETYYRWKDANGEGELQTGAEPYEGFIAITSGESRSNYYAIAEYTSLRDQSKVHEIWYNYSGKDKKLYVYIADYDEHGNVTKPNTPTLSCSIDLEERFEGVHMADIVMDGTTGTRALWNYNDFNLYGMEFKSKLPYCN